MDDSQVVPRSKCKSMLAAKSFNPVREMSEIKFWLQILASELVARMETDYEETGREPKTFTVHYRATSMMAGKDRSKSCPMPRNRFEVETLVKVSLQQIGNAPDLFPCTRLA
eukprot:Colp12_sorted_trinity150504_noHs@21270